MNWEVLFKGLFDKDYELSVIRSNYDHGHKSWGWVGQDKIILFSTLVGGNQLSPQTPETIEFARMVALGLRDLLNDRGV